MRYIIGIFVLMLTACSSQTEKTYYQLPDIYQTGVSEQVTTIQSAKKPPNLGSADPFVQYAG
ncbi:lipoprotein [Proteus vulgaris]|nr:lipoprotein [Proteus vulgaris]